MFLDAVTKGTTDYSTTIRIVDSTDGTPETGVVFNTAGIDLWYRRPAAAHSSITEATQTEGGAHTDGGFVHISDGYYRLDLPDAAVASGADYVDVGGTVTGMVVIGGRIRLTDLDLDDSVRAGLTALPNAAADAAGGLPISDAGGLDLDARIQTDIAAILVDTGTTLDTKLDDIQGSGFNSSTDSLEAIRDRGDSAWTGSAITSDSGTAQGGSLTTITLAATAPSTDNVLEGHIVYISSGTGAGQAKAIDENGYNGTTKVATIIGQWEVSPDATSVYDVFPDAITEITDPPTADEVADAVWDENTTGHTASGSFGEQVKNDIDAILIDTAELQEDWTDGGRLDLIVDAILVDTAEIGTAGAGLTAVPWNSAWDTEVDDRLVAIGLDHLVSTSVAGTDIADNSIIAQLVSSSATADWDDFDNTTDGLQAIKDTIGAGGVSLVNIPWNSSWDAEVQSECNDALVALHLDHLLAADYDPSSKPGVATALFNELVENDSGVSRFTSNALEQAMQVTLTELSTLPGASPTLSQAIMLAYMAKRNKHDTTSTTDEIHNDAGTVIATAAVSDDSTTFTRAKYA